MSSANALGDYLRARRELGRPEDVGLRSTGLRRVPGLRREEVALLAGISAQYYLRLEQGRDRTPSDQVLEAIARVLHLDADATAYLLTLGRTHPGRRAVPAELERVPSGVLVLLDTINVPAFVVNRYRDVLAANRPAQTLSPLMAPGVNRLRALFTDPAAQAFHPDWQQNAGALVAQLRAEAVPGDPRFASLIGELSLESERFRTLWARHDVARGGSAVNTVQHPELGPLELHREKFLIPGEDGLQIVMYHAAPGTASAEALTLLGTLAAADGADRTESPR